MADSQKELLIEISQLLARLKIPYMITGAWNVIYYGRPRASHDIDFIIELNSNKAEELIEDFSKQSLFRNPEARRYSCIKD